MVGVIDICPRCGEYGSKYVAKVKGIPYLYFSHREGGRVIRRCYIGRAGGKPKAGERLGAVKRPRTVGRPRGVAHVKRSKGVGVGDRMAELLLVEKIVRGLSRGEERKVEVVDDELRKMIEDYVRLESEVEEKVLGLSIFLLSLPLLMVFFPSGIPILVEKFERIISGSGNA